MLPRKILAGLLVHEEVFSRYIFCIHRDPLPVLVLVCTGNADVSIGHVHLSQQRIWQQPVLGPLPFIINIAVATVCTAAMLALHMLAFLVLIKGESARQQNPYNGSNLVLRDTAVVYEFLFFPMNLLYAAHAANRLKVS